MVSVKRGEAGVMSEHRRHAVADPWQPEWLAAPAEGQRDQAWGERANDRERRAALDRQIGDQRRVTERIQQRLEIVAGGRGMSPSSSSSAEPERKP